MTIKNKAKCKSPEKTRDT